MIDKKLERIKEAYDKARKQSEERTYVYGILGRINGDGSITVGVPNRPRYVYVRIGTELERQLTIASNDVGVEQRANLPVRMVRENNKLIIKDKASPSNETSTGTDPVIPSGVLPHTHALGSELEYIIENLRLESGLVRPIGGYTVKILPVRYKVGDIWKTYAGEEYDISVLNQPLTTGKWYWVLFTIDTVNNVLEVFNSSEENYATSLTTTMLNGIDIGNNIPLVAYKSRADDTNVTDITRYYDARQWITGNQPNLTDLWDVHIDTPGLRHFLVYDTADTRWENRIITSVDVSDFNEAAMDAIGGSLVDTASINATYNDGTSQITFDVLPSGVDHGGLGGLTDVADHPGYLTIDGSRTSGTNPQVFDKNPQAPNYDFKLYDATNGDHFNTDGVTYPVGWTEVSSPFYGNSVSNGFWIVANGGADTTWGYKKQPGFTVESLGSNAYISALYGPIRVMDSRNAADLTYYFGLYRDSTGIDITTFNRIALNWDSASSVWRVRHEYKDGTTQTNGYWFNLPYPPLQQDLWFRITLQNDTNKSIRAYVSYDQSYRAQSLIGNADIGSGVTWGNVWNQVSQIRGSSGTIDILSIGGIDYLTLDDGEPGTVVAPPTPSVSGHTHVAIDVTDFTEAVQDIMGAILVDAGDMDWTYTDGSNTLSAIIAANKVTNTKLDDMAQSTVKGRAVAAGTGDPTDLTATQLNAIVGSVALTLSTYLEINNTNPFFFLHDSDAATNEKRVDFTTNSGQFIIRLINDTYSANTNIIVVERTAMTIDSVDINGAKINLNSKISVNGNNSNAYLGIDGVTGTRTVDIEPGTTSGNTDEALVIKYDEDWNLKILQEFIAGSRLAYHFRHDFSGTSYDMISFEGNYATGGPGIGIRNTRPLHVLHGKGRVNTAHNYAFLEASGIAGSNVAIIADGADDVTKRIIFMVVVEASDGTTQSQQSSMVNAGGSAIFYLNGANQLEGQVNANGSFTLIRTGGSLTYKVSMWAVWI